MDIMNLIGKCVEISVRKQILEETIQRAEKSEIYAQIKGDIAYFERNIEKEQKYNDSLRNHIETKKSAEKDLSQIMQLLEFTYQLYLQAVNSMDQIQLKEVSTKISVKIDEIQRKLVQLSERREWAILKGDIAYSEKNIKEEQEYNKISSDCFLEIEEITPSLQYYNSFVYDLNYRATQKQDFELTNPKR